MLTENNGRQYTVCQGFVTMATINILALPTTVAMATSHKALTTLASEVIQLIEEHGESEQVVSTISYN